MRLVNLSTAKIREFAMLPSVGSRCTYGRALCACIFMRNVHLRVSSRVWACTERRAHAKRAASRDVTVVRLSWAVPYRGLLGAGNLVGNVTESNVGLNHNVIFLGN